MAKQKITVTRTDGKKAVFTAENRRNAERDAEAMRKNFPGRIKDIEIQDK